MKKRILALIMAGVMVISLAACGSTSSESSDGTDTAESTSSDGDINISFVLKTTAAEVYQIIIAGAQDYANANDDVSVDVKGASSETSYDEQANIIETDLASGDYDAMIIHPSQPETAATLVSGTTIPIIDFESSFDAEEVTSYVGITQQDAAYTGAEAAVELAVERGWEEITCIGIAGIQGDANSEARMEGYMNGVNENGGTFLEDEIQYSDAVADEAVNCMEAIMQNHPEGVAIIVCHNDDVAMAAKRAAEGNEAYENTVFLGFDGISSACEAIIDGEETMSIAVDWYTAGYLCVEAAAEAARGETIEEGIYVDVNVIDETNAAEYLETLQGYIESVE